MKNLSDCLEGVKKGFSINEVMSGDHEFVGEAGPEGRLPFEFRVRWGPPNVFKWLNPWSERFLRQPLAGTVTVGGLCEAAPCAGTLELRYFKDHTIRYTFDFEVEGVTYHYVGEKVNIKPWNLPTSHTTCFGVLVEKQTGRLMSRSVTHFRLATVPAFVGSFQFQ